MRPPITPEERAALDHAARTSSKTATSRRAQDHVQVIESQESAERRAMMQQGEHGSFLVAGQPYRIDDGGAYGQSAQDAVIERDPESPQAQMAAEDRGGRVWRFVRGMLP